MGRPVFSISKPNMAEVGFGSESCTEYNDFVHFNPPIVVFQSCSDGWGEWGQETHLSAVAAELPQTAADTPPPTAQQELPKTPKSHSRNPSGDISKSGASGKLETLPRDDLIKFVKKQMVLLQRTKAKCDELSKEVVVLKAAPPTANVERQDAQKETLAQVEQLKHELGATHEQLKAADEKFGDWESLMAMLKDDRDRLESDVIAFEERESLSMTELDDLNSSLTEALQERDTLRDQMCRLTEGGGITASIKTLKQTLEDLKFERDELNEKLSSFQEQNEQLMKDTELLNSENEHQAKELQVQKEKVQQMAEDKHKIDADHSKLLIEKDALVNELTEKDSGAASNAVELTELRTKVQNFDRDHAMILVGVEEFKRQTEITQEELAKAQKELVESRRQIESFLPERVMLEQKLADLSAIRRQADIVYEENEQLKIKVTNLSETENELADVKGQQESLSLELSTQRVKLSQLHQQLQTVEEEKLTLVQKVPILRLEKEAAVEKIKNIETERNYISKAMEELKCDLNSKSQEVQSFLSERVMLEQKLADLSAIQCQTDVIYAENEQLKKQVTDLSGTETELFNVKGQQESLYLELSIQREKLSQLQEQLQTAEEQKQTLIQEVPILRLEKEAAVERIKNIESERDHILKAMEELKCDLKSKSQVVQSLGTFNGLETSSGKLREKLKVSDEKLNELGDKHVVSGELEQLKDFVESMKQVSDSTAQELTIVKEELTKLQEDKTRLEEQLTASEAGKVQLVEQLQQVTQTVSQIKTDRSQVEEERDMFKSQLREALEEQIKVDDIEKHRSEVEHSSRVQSEMMDAKMADLEAKIQERTNQLSAIKTDLKQTKSNEAQLRLKLQDDANENNSLKDQLNAKESEKSSLVSNLKKSEGEISEIQQQLYQAGQKVASLEGHIQEMEKNSNSLQTKLAEITDNYEKTLSEQNMLKEELSSRLHNLDEAHQELLGKQAEISELRQSAKSAETMQQSTSDREDLKITKLQKDLKEANDKMNKFKQLALKAKKESNDLKSRLDKVSGELESAKKESDEEVTLNCQVEALQMERTGLRERLQAAEVECEELKRQLTEAAEKWEQADGEHQKVRHDLEAARILQEQFMKDKQQLDAEVTRLQEKMTQSENTHETMVKTLQAKLEDLQGKLSNAQKDAQQSSMMDLEIADYERTVQTLNEQMAEHDAEIETTRREVIRQEEKVTALIKQLESSEAQSAAAEERANKLKQLLVKSKKDLADAKKIESEQRAADAHLQGKLELFNQQSEEQKIQIAGLVKENTKLVEKMRGSTDSNLRSVRSLELKVATLQGDLDLTKTELDSVQTEYDKYKIRVHNVLKQQKDRGPNDGPHQMDKQERERLEDAIDQLKSKVKDLSEQLSSAMSDIEVLQEEHERLQMRHTRLLQDLTDKEAMWKARLDHVTTDTSTSLKEHEETVHQLSMQNDALTKTFKDQMRLMQEEHRRAVDILQVQVERATSQAMSARYDSPTNKSPTHGESDPDTDSSHRCPLHTEERQAAEGMELPEPETCKRTLMTSPLSQIPFEQLLNSPPASPAPMSLDMLNDSLLRSNLATAQQRIEHLSGLMNESEATVLRLTEQARILKEEIRRQERNMERNQHVEKAEYLKNIILKFLTLETEDERKQLIPVLVTMLRLSPDEKNTLMSIARGGKEDVEKDATGWSGYLHRWSGLI